jgi:hypothetical protein
MRKFRMEIEGLWVDIFYEYEEGDKGDYYTPPTGPSVDIVEWRLDGVAYDDYKFDYSEEEWEEWMCDIDKYVNNDAQWDIIEFEESLKW